MKCYGVPMKRVCRAVAEGANGGEWCQATVVVGHLRGEIAPEHATRLYLQWGNHAEVELRKQHPADVRVDRGRKCVAFRCLSFAKARGLLESQGPPGGKREYRLTDKGNQLIQGGAVCQG